jgi:hypothetical protein
MTSTIANTTKITVVIVFLLTPHPSLVGSHLDNSIKAGTPRRIPRPDRPGAPEGGAHTTRYYVSYVQVWQARSPVYIRRTLAGVRGGNQYRPGIL